MHFCIQVADVDAAVLPDATATIVVSDVDASPNHMNDKKKIMSLSGLYFMASFVDIETREQSDG